MNAKLYTAFQAVKILETNKQKNKHKKTGN